MTRFSEYLLDEIVKEKRNTLENQVVFKIRICGLHSFTTMGSGRNKKLPPRRLLTLGILRVIRRTTTQHLPTNIITMVLRLPPLLRQFYESLQSDTWAAIRRV